MVYTTMGLPKENDNFQLVYVQFERFRAEQPCWARVANAFQMRSLL